MAEILVGTCSWTDKTLIESVCFYPEWARSAEARLQYYASQFGIVEVDSSYYALPNERTSQLWVERTADSFVFDIKAFRLFTHHPTPMRALPKDIRQNLPPMPKGRANIYQRDMPAELSDELWSRFEQALLPLSSVGKLGVDALNSQLFCMDFSDLAKRAKGRITFWGEIDRQHVLPSNDPQMARDAVRKVAEYLFDSAGGVIAQFEFGLSARPDSVMAVFDEWERVDSEYRHFI